MLEANEREEGVVVLHLLIGSFKTALDWSRYRDANPVPTSPLADDITTAPSGPVLHDMNKGFICAVLYV